MLREVLLDTIAGAAGMVALNGVTYADMAVRGWPPSSVPSQVAGQLVGKLGIDLSAEDRARRRLRALVRPRLGGEVSKLRAGVVLCLAAMAGSDGVVGHDLGRSRPEAVRSQQLAL